MKKYRFALMSFVFVALAAYALSPATQWGDVPPTNTLAEVAAGAGLATTTSVANAIATEASTRASQVAQAYANATNEAARSARDKYVPLDGSMRMTGPLQASQYVGFDGGNQQTYYSNQCVLFSFWGARYYFNFPASFDTGIGNSTNTYFATRYWTDSFVSNRVAAALAGYAYNLYPVDLGGGTREVPSDTQTYMAIGYDVSVTGMASTVVGNAARARGENSSAFGYGAEALADNSLVVGAHSTAGGTQSLAIGVQAAAGAYGFAIGNAAEAPADGTALGFQAKGTGPGTAIGAHAEATGWESAAIGHNAVASGASSIQLGTGTNNSNNSVKVYGRMLLDADGHVPLLTGQSYDLSDAADVTRALGDIITALGGTVE